MPKLYSKCLASENIEKAIKAVLSHEGSRTPGPDGITNSHDIPMETYFREVKLRLRRFKRVHSRTVNIPKDNGKTRKLTICNLYDRIAQQAVYQIIEPILDKQMSIHSYGFRKGINGKIAVAKIANCILKAKQVYTVEIDFNKCFDNIPLDKSIGQIASLGIKDSKLLATIKHLMYISKEYNGIGLGQGTILGPILANCYLHKLDLWIENHLDLGPVYNKTRDLEKHGDNYVEWLKSRNRKMQGKYFRYADDTIIVCYSRSEQLAIERDLKEFINNELDITVNDTKSKLNYNQTSFLGYKIRKVKREKEYIGLYIKDEESLKEVVKKCEFNGYEEVWRFKKWLVGILNYYDMANNIGDLLAYIDKRMYMRTLRKKNLHKTEGKSVYTYVYRDKDIVIDVYDIRKATRTSFKEYLISSQWISEREKLQLWEMGENKLWDIYKWALYTRQKGKDPVTGKIMSSGNIHIHHIKPRKKQGLNSLDNLIMVSTETHKLIHSKEPSKNVKLIQLRKHLVPSNVR